MTRGQFEHAIRAAGGVLGATEVLVIGSQALHATVVGTLPLEAERSMEVNVVPIADEDGHLADLIDGSIGEASMFHETFGYYAQGVSEHTAILPEGWRDRLVRFETSATRGVVAWCLEVHDLWIAKAIAGRPKDVEFCKALKAAGTVDPLVLAERLARVENLAPARLKRVRTLIGS